MNSIFVSLLFIFIYNVFVAQSTLSIFIQDTDKFLSEYVKNGEVDYEAINDNKSKINALALQIENHQLSGNQNEDKAFLINAYNILVIHQIVDNWPINSPMNIAGFFEKNKFSIAGKKYTLNDIENELIRKQFNDPRVHFVLVCGAKGCPPIIPSVYFPDSLDAQLEKQTSLALNHPDFIKVNNENKSATISEIFKWYEKDFYSDSTDVLAYINIYRSQEIPRTYQITHYEYDWSLNGKVSSFFYTKRSISNVQTYTPSVILKKGQVDITLFNNLYSQTAFRDSQRQIVNLNSRDNYYTMLFQSLIGISENGRVNLGLDVNLKSVFIDGQKRSPLQTFAFSGSSSEQRTAITSFGPKIKLNPFKKINRLSIQSAFWIPVGKNLEGDNGLSPWMDFERFTSWTQFFYDYNFHPKWQMFFEVDVLARIPKPKNSYLNNQPKGFEFSFPSSFFLSFFPTQKMTTYGMVQYSPNVSTSSDFTQIGLGAKYQLTKNLQIELLYSDFILSKNGGAGKTYNLGLKFIR